MWLGKLSLKAAALVLVGVFSSTFAQNNGPMNISADDWNYLANFKLWGTFGITTKNRPEFYDSRLYNRKNESDFSRYNGVNPDTLGWVGTADGSLTTDEVGWFDGPIIVGGSITAPTGYSNDRKAYLLTGPIRVKQGGSLTTRYRGSVCRGNDTSSEQCKNVPLIRPNLSVPGLSVNLDNRDVFTVGGTTELDIENYCTIDNHSICNIFFNSIRFNGESKLIVKMPKGGYPTRIFTNSLTFGTHPQITVDYGNGALDTSNIDLYKGDLLIYSAKDILFENNDDRLFMGTIVSKGSITMKCNIVFAGQFIANSLNIGNEVRAEKFVFKKFDPKIVLTILGNNANKFEESSSWQTINVGLDNPADTIVSFDYCFYFDSEKGSSGTYAGYVPEKTGLDPDVGAGDSGHKFPICNRGEKENVKIPKGQTKVTGINIKPMIDGIIEDEEALWFQVTNLNGATLATNYENHGYKLYIISNDKAPTGNSSLVVDVDEDTKHVFTEAEFKFQHSTQKFASVKITGLPAKGTLVFDGTPITSSGLTIAVKDLAKFTYQAAANDFGKNYTTFKFKVVGDGAADNASPEYTAKVNVVAVNDKPTTESKYTFAVSENPAKDESLGYTTYNDVANEKNVDSYKFALVTTDANYTEFSKYFVLTSSGEVKVNGRQTFDYYMKSSYTVTATVSDDAKTESNYGETRNGPQTSKPFTITVNVKNQNHAPTIANQTFTIAEKQADGSDWPSDKTVGDVKALDSDNDALSFTVVTSGIPFKFKNGTKELVIADGSVLDFETKPTWTFKVTVSDGDKEASANITVNLTDVNEPIYPPVIKNEYTVNENTDEHSAVVSIGSFEVFDQDAGDELKYTLTGVLTGAADATIAKKNLSDIFELKETKNTNGTRTVSINVKDAALLDYEALYSTSKGNATYQATITITDKASHKVTKTTNIAIKDVNEKVSAKGGTFVLNEHSPIGSPVCAEKYKDDKGIPLDCKTVARVEGSDLDIFNASFSTLTYEIIKSKNTGMDYSLFTVNKNTGVLYTSEEFDYETQKHVFEFVVTVSDGEFTADAKVVVNLDDIKEPEISYDYDGDVIVREDAQKDDQIVDFNDIIEELKDKDATVKENLNKIVGKTKYTVNQDASANASGIFDITAGVVKVNDPAKLDFESLYPNKLTYTVVVNASGTQANGTPITVPINLEISVTDVNEKPEIKGASSVNDPPTGVTKGDFEIFVPETWTNADDFFGKVLATDPDNAYAPISHPAGFDKLIYKIEDVIPVDGSSDFPFELDANTGKFTVIDTKKLDYTKQKQYKCVVRVVDNPSLFNKDGKLVYPALSATATIVINVIDVNRPSEFRVLSDLYDIDENVAVGSKFKGSIVVYDEDKADIDALSISITDKGATAAIDAAELFEVVPVGGTDANNLTTFAIQTKKDLDYEKLYKATEKDAIFDVTLTINDGSGTPTSKTTKIRVNDVNEEPAFEKDSYEFDVKENTTMATSLGVAKASDPDKYNPSFGTLYFSLEGADAAQFDINTSTGEISTISNAKLDYETKSVYTFNAVVTDKKFTVKVPVTVKIVDVPEVPKFPDNPPSLAVDENTKKDTKVGVVTAEDDDCKGSFSTTCKQPTYALAATDTDADDYKSFTIDPTTGTIKVAKDSILNYEVQKEYSVRVVATDGDDKTLSSYIDVTIKINDVNDAPTYEKKDYVFEIHENAPKGEFIGTVVAGDEDTWSKLTFALSDAVDGSGDNATFYIDDNGSIFLATKTLNYEKKKEYKVVATATDNGKDKGFDNYTAKTNVTIKIIDDPDKPTIKDDGKPGYDVAENTVDKNTPTGFEIACYEVSDEDEGQVETLNAYVKDVGNTDADRLFGAKIKKDGSTYKVCLIVKDGDRLNYEAIEHVHNVIVAVMDADKLTAEVTKKLNLTDVNEMPIISGSNVFTFYDRNKVGDVVGKIYSDDTDTSTVFTDNVFSAVGGDTDAFEITEDGKIKAKKVFDFQKDTKLTYELIVALSDRDNKTYPKLTTQKTITITIKNRPKAPEITSKEFKVKENSDGGTPIGVIEAKDPDGDDKQLLFELSDDNPYVIVTQEGEIKVKDGAEIDFEKMQEFTISVTVTDIDGMYTDGDIVIKVVDVNEAPKITPQEFTFPEDSKPGSKKGPIEAKDPDTKNPDFNDLKFYPVDENEKFEIKTNGDIVLKGELDYEKDKSYVIKVYVTDGEFNDTTEITVNVGNVVEKSEVEITRVEAGDSVYLNPKKEDIIYTNKEVILVEWKQDGKTKSSLDTLKEGCQQIIKTFKDPSKDIAGADTIEVCYSTASPVVDVFAPKTKVTADNIFTVVETVDKKDSSIYVNEKDKDVKVTVKDTVSGYTETFNVTVVLDTVAVPDKAVKTLIDVSKSQPSLDKNPKSGVSTTPVNDNKTVVSYKETVDGHDIVISYNVDNNGDIIKVPVIGEDGQKKMTEVIEVSTTVEVKGKSVVVSYKADAETGKMLYGDSEGNLMVDVPSTSSSKPTSSSSKKGDSSSSSKKDDSKDSDEVDLKTGVGAFTVTYDAKGVEGNKATVSYVIDEKGKIVANDEGDRGYLVTYTYTNKYGNSADKSVFMVLDKVKPFVKILSPSENDVIYANYVDVDWCISIDGDKDNCVKQDTLNFESLHKGVNTIKRIYRDKAGNEMVAEVSVMMKKAKDVNIDLEKPMILVSIDSVDKYYSSNPPEEDQSYAVSILNPTTHKEKEVVKGFDGDTKKGSGDEPYPGFDGHIGPTLKIDLKLPVATSVGGLATLDDIIINGDMVVLDEVDAADAEKVTVKEYVKKYCSDEFQKEFKSLKDYSKATLYESKAHVKLWFYTTGGQFIDKFSFDYDVDDPDYVDKAGLVKFFFEMKPDMNGELRDTRGRLYGTGPFIVKTNVDIRSKLRCVVPPINENSNKIGDVLKSSDELLTRFGYRRPVLHGNDRPLQKSSKKESSKSSSKSSKKK